MYGEESRNRFISINGLSDAIGVLLFLVGYIPKIENFVSFTDDQILKYHF